MPTRNSASVLSNSFPSGAAPFSGAFSIFGQAIAANPRRVTMFVQNIHTGVSLYVLLGTGFAGTGNFSLILNPAGNLGFGGERFQNDVYKGSVFCSGGAWQAWDM